MVIEEQIQRARALMIEYWDKENVKDIKAASKYFRPATEEEIPHKPKFKVGNWVVHNFDDGRVSPPRKIVDITNKSYILDGNDFNVFYFKDLEDSYRLWTIQDAKNGDVLCYKGEVSLYKREIKNYGKEKIIFGGFVYHCCYDNKRFITDSLYYLTDVDEKDIYPATKEQRDLLFQKMSEAGYWWDTEIKTLKKTQKPEKELTEFEKALYTIVNEGMPDRYQMSSAVVKEKAEELLSLAKKELLIKQR